MITSVRAWTQLYSMWIKTSIVVMFQYRVSQLFWLVALMVEPVIYLVVWTTIARAQGGSLGGYTVGEFAAYYIGWTLVRHMNIALTPYAFEERIRQGQLSQELMRPVHPFHFDMAWFLGMKVVSTVLWLPIVVVLIVLFKPELHPAPWQALAFAVALVTAFLMRFMLLWALGLATFWLTRVSALFELYFTVELLISGRLVPLGLLPPWVQAISWYVPFRWGFDFQLELLLGRLSPLDTVVGFAAQAFWFVVGYALVQLFWRAGLKRYSAVGA